MPSTALKCPRCGVPFEIHGYDVEGHPRCNKYYKGLLAYEAMMLTLPDGDDPILRDEFGRLIRASVLAKRYRREMMTRQNFRHGHKR